MVTDEQVRLLMSLLSQGMLQVTAAAKAGMSERTARKYVHSGRAPSQAKVAHTWRTRPIRSWRCGLKWKRCCARIPVCRRRRSGWS